MEFEVDGRVIRTDEQGYLVELEDWSEDFARALAAHEGFELFVGNLDVLIFSEFVPFNQAFALYDFVAHRTEALLAYPVTTLGMEQIEANTLSISALCH